MQDSGGMAFVAMALIVGVWSAMHMAQRAEKRIVNLERRLKEQGVLKPDDQRGA